MKFIKKTVVSFFIIAAILVLYSVFESFNVEIREDDVISEELSSEFEKCKIVFISDIHCTWYFKEDRIRKITQKINRLNPDIIILGGDYIYGNEKYIENCFNGLKELKSKYGIFAVFGNHDEGEVKDKIKKSITKNGFYLMDNDSKWIVKSKSKIKIGGLGEYLYEYQDLDKISSDVKKEDFLIAVSHNPDFAEKIKNKKVDLVLSGHTHGGQITFFRKWFPLINSDYGTKYLGGVVKNGETVVIVSNGIGTIVLPMRFCARPQINLITLKKRK